MLRIWNHTLLLTHTGCVVMFTAQRVDIPVDSAVFWLLEAKFIYLFIIIVFLLLIQLDF